MNKYWQRLLTVGSIATLSASTAFGQIGYNGYNGACAPNCELPPVCEPVCDVPPTACEPTCDVPPTCGPAIGCDSYCEPGYGYGCGYGDFCNPCYDVAAIVGGALDVATAPFHWAAAMLTEGIYPDCGCAPRPPKTNCDPCDICGNFVGGCGEECETPACAGNYAYNGYAAGYDAYGAGSYPVGAYDAETYDASPTRQKSAPALAPTQNAAPETLPQEAVRRGGLSFAPRPQAPRYGRPSFAFGGFDVQALVNNKRQAPSRVAPLPVRRNEEYVVQAPTPNASPIRQVSNLTRSTQNSQIRQAAVVPHSSEIRRSARYPQPTQTVVPNVPNVRSTQPANARPLADATPLVEERAAGRPRTFGQVRPNPTNAR